MTTTRTPTVREAIDFDRYARHAVGRTRPEIYPALVADWNVAIGVIHGRPFDPSHDRERGSSG